MRPVVVEGVLRHDETCNIIASTKVGKSFLGGNLAWCIATGTPWLSRKVKQGKVLRELGKPYIGDYTHSVEPSDNGFRRVSYSRCPGTVGYNVVESSLPSTVDPDNPGIVSLEFRGIKPHHTITQRPQAFNLDGDTALLHWPRMVADAMEPCIAMQVRRSNSNCLRNANESGLL